MAHRPEDVRNVALVGAGGAGKTTLLETALFLAKATARKGTVEEGNTVSDFDPDAKERRQSLTATPVHLTWAGKRIQVIDTPGSQDFVGEPTAAEAAVETIAVCVNAHDGVGVGARRRFHHSALLLQLARHVDARDPREDREREQDAPLRRERLEKHQRHR